MRVHVPEGDAGGAKGGEAREGGLAPREPGERGVGNGWSKVAEGAQRVRSWRAWMANRSAVESGSVRSGTRNVACMRSKGSMGSTPCTMKKGE